MSISMDITPLNDWLPHGKGPLVISGPCSAETEEQLLGTAMELARIEQVSVLRSGIWKPRSRPEAFEGVGDIGLGWMIKARELSGLKVAVEVATASHIEACLKHKIDIIWIGSRTVVNPFSVHEIAAALRGVDIPVMIKNPVNPDIKLWIGAIERLYKCGINKMIAIHRGFSSYESGPFRNLPLWEIPVELKRLIPDIPLIIDPSHMCGNRQMLMEVTQFAIDLAYDGMMIETHIEPDKALTDKEQQISPDQLSELLEKIQYRSNNISPEEGKELEILRREIDLIDEKLLNNLSQRMEIVKKIGKYKRAKGMTAFQIERWKVMMEDRLLKASARGLDREFILKLMQIIHKEALRMQAGGKEDLSNTRF